MEQHHDGADDDAEAIPNTKEHARSKYQHGRLPLFSNKTRGAHSCMMTIDHQSRVCEPKGMWCPSRTSQAEHEVAVAASHMHVSSDPAHAMASTRRKSGSVSSDDSGRSTSPSERDQATPPRMHYERPQRRHQSKKESLRTSKEMSHHRDRIQRREDLANGL